MNFSYPFSGLGVALITPFNANGEIDWKALSSIVENLISGGADFLCVLGTTAETPTLTARERMDVLQHVIRQNTGRLPILVGCSSNCTAQAVSDIRQFQIEGVDGILSCVPYYNKPSQEGIYRHFAEIAKASDKQIILYNIPGRTGVNMTAATCLRIAGEFPNVTGVKEASGNMDQVREIMASAPEHFKVIIGDDALAMQAIGDGAAGVISVIGNALPRTYGKLIHASMEGRKADAQVIQNQLEPLYGLLFKEGNPCGVKDLMASRGMIQNETRLPLVPVSEQLHRQIVEGFKEIVE